MNYERKFKPQHTRYVMFLQKVCTKKLLQEHPDLNIIELSRNRVNLGNTQTQLN